MAGIEAPEQLRYRRDVFLPAVEGRGVGNP